MLLRGSLLDFWNYVIVLHTRVFLTVNPKLSYAF